MCGVRNYPLLVFAEHEIMRNENSAFGACQTFKRHAPYIRDLGGVTPNFG